MSSDHLSPVMSKKKTYTKADGGSNAPMTCFRQGIGETEASLVVKKTGKGKVKKLEKAEKKRLKHIFRIKPRS